MIPDTRAYPGTHTEVESGKHDDRPELIKVMITPNSGVQPCSLRSSTDISRDAHFLLGLQKASVPITACDMRHADQFMVGIMALVAQKEREAISQRKGGPGGGETRGVKLDNPNGARHLRGIGNSAAVASLKASAQERAPRLRATIEGTRAGGITSSNASPLPPQGARRGQPGPFST